jgi:hypothetical protein
MEWKGKIRKKKQKYFIRVADVNFFLGGGGKISCTECCIWN